VKHYIYMSESIEGNLHDLALFLNRSDVYKGWRLVVAERSGRYVIFILELEVDK